MKDRAALAAAEKAARPSLWAERHRPQHLKWIKLRCWEELGRWLRSWSTAPPPKRSALILGPVGVGKSTGARLTAEKSRGPGEKQGSKRVLEYDIKERDGRSFIENLAKGQATYGSLANTVVLLEIDGVCNNFLDKSLRRVLRQSPVPLVLICSDPSLADDESLAGACLRIEVPRQPVEQVVENLQRIGVSENLAASSESWAVLAEACGGDLRRAVNSMQLFGAPTEAGELLNTVATPQAACGRLLARRGEAAPLTMQARFELLSIDEELLTLMIQENYLKARVEESAAPVVGDSSDTSSSCCLEACAAAADVLAWGDVLSAEGTNCGGDVDFMKSALMMAAVLPTALVAQSKVDLAEDAGAAAACQAPCRKLCCSLPSSLEGAHPLHWAAIGELSREYNLPRLRICGELLRWRRSVGRSRDEPKKAPIALASQLKKWAATLHSLSSRATERAILAHLPARLAAALDAALGSGELMAALATVVESSTEEQQVIDRDMAVEAEHGDRAPAEDEAEDKASVTSDVVSSALEREFEDEMRSPTDGSAAPEEAAVQTMSLMCINMP